MKLTSEQKVALILARKTLEFELELAENAYAAVVWEVKDKFKRNFLFHQNFTITLAFSRRLER